MALRDAILGLLLEAPKTGFELVREFDVARSVIWPAPQNEVYRVLAALAAEGLISEHATGARGARSYAVTDDGRRQLAAWLAAPSDYTLRYEPVLKAVFLRDAPPALRQARAAADLEFFRAQIALLEAHAARRAAEASPDHRGDARDMALSLYRALADWAATIAAR